MTVKYANSLSEMLKTGLPKIVTIKDASLHWGADGDEFYCHFCGKTFRVGDLFRWQYTNDIPNAGGNPLVCRSCDEGREGTRMKWKEKCEEWRGITNSQEWRFFKKR